MNVFQIPFLERLQKKIYNSLVQFLLNCADTISMYGPSGPAVFPGLPQGVNYCTLTSDVWAGDQGAGHELVVNVKAVKRWSGAI